MIQGGNKMYMVKVSFNESVVYALTYKAKKQLIKGLKTLKRFLMMKVMRLNC